MRKVLILVKVFFFFWGWKYDHGCYVVEPSRILDFLHFFYILTCIFVNIHGAACCIYLKFVTWHSVRWTYWDIIASVLYCNFAPVKEETNPPKVKIYVIIKLTWSVSCNISSRAMWKQSSPSCTYLVPCQFYIPLLISKRVRSSQLSYLFSPSLSQPLVAPIEITAFMFLRHSVTPTSQRTRVWSVSAGWVFGMSHTQKVLSVQPPAPPSWWISRPSTTSTTHYSVFTKSGPGWEHRAWLGHP